MGAWGAGIFENDISVDVRDTFEEYLAAGLPPTDAAAKTIGEFEDEAEDYDEGPDIVLALAALLADNGVTADPVIESALDIIDNREGLERWEGAGDETLAERVAVYETLGARLRKS